MRSLLGALCLFLTVCSYGQAIFSTNGLVAYYGLDGNAIDGTGNGFNGIVSANCWFTTNRFGNPSGALFITNDQASADADTGRIDLPAAALNSLSSGTFSAWIKLKDIRTADIVAKQHNFVNTYGIFSVGCYMSADGGQIAGNPGTLYFRAGNSLPLGTSTNTVVAGVWQHVVLTFNSASCAFYLNGVPVGNGTGNFSIPSDSNPTTTSIGCWYGYPWSGTNLLRSVGTFDDVRIYNRVLSTNQVAHLYAVEAAGFQVPWQATGTAVITNGFLVGVNVTDGGYGYTNAPLVHIIGGGGNGAQATAVVSNSVVIAVNVSNTGSGYTNTPTIVIDPPFVPQPGITVVPASFLSFTNILVGTNYQLQLLQSGVWFNQGSAFMASSNQYLQYVIGVVSSNYYRLEKLPAPAQAYASASLVNGFVVGITVTNGGAGYVTNPIPAVTIVGGGGSGATVTAHVTNGVVSSISINGTGSGYTSQPAVQIEAPPPATGLYPSVTRALKMDFTFLLPYNNYQIESKSALAGAWASNGAPFSPVSSTSFQYVLLTNSAGFFRLKYLP